MTLRTICRPAVAVVLAGLFWSGLAAPPSPAGAGPQDKPPAGDSPKELAPKTVTLQGKDVPMKAALTALFKQTGNRVADRRQMKADTRLKLNLEKAGFWQALDAIAREADARISLFEQDGALALVDGPYRELPVSVNGLFRTTVKRIDLTHVLEADAHYATLLLEVAWESRFRPFFVETKPESLTVEDDKKNALPINDEGKGQAPVESPNAMELRVRIPAPRRSAQALGLFKGTLAATGAGKMLDFTFDDLARAAKPGKKAQPVKQTKDGVSVHLRRFIVEDDGDKLWTIEVMLEYPAAGPKFESFQSWFIHNDIYLLKEKDGLEIKFPNNAGLETDDASDTKAIIRYRFADEPDKKLLLGQPGDWKLVYRTPGKFVEAPVVFEFKDVPLP